MGTIDKLLQEEDLSKFEAIAMKKPAEKHTLQKTLQMRVKILDNLR